jgi:hypothetical protein
MRWVTIVPIEKQKERARRSKMNDVAVKDRKPQDSRKTGTSGSVNGPKNPWDVDVDVYLHSETPGDFTIQSYLQSTPGSTDLNFFNSGHPGFNVSFKLHDETGLGYGFPNGAKSCDAIWSQVMAGGCPASPGAWEVFEKNSIVITNGGSVLKVKNPNPCPAQGHFQYTLNVTKDGGATYLPLDPGGNNQNGTSLD